MVTDEPCTVCGERNPGRAQFCTFCGAYLGWDDEDEPTGLVLLDEPVAERVRHEPVPPSSPEGGAQEEAVAGESGKDAGLPRFPVPQHARAGYDRTRPRPPEGRRRSQPQDPTTVFRLPGRPGPEDGGGPGQGPAGAGPGGGGRRDPRWSTGGRRGAGGQHLHHRAGLRRHRRQRSPWLVVVDGRVELLPGADEQVLVHLSIRPEDLVPVQRARLRLRVQAESALELRRDVGVDLVVSAVAAPPQLRLEPSTLRARDSTTALFRVIVDNRRSNEVRRVHLTGSDPELAARFGFTPEHLEVPSGGAVAARLRVDAPLPEPGEQLTRTLNVVAVDGRSEYEARATFVQTSSAPVVDPPVSVRLDPSVVRVKDGAVGHATVVLDNRAVSEEAPRVGSVV